MAKHTNRGRSHDHIALGAYGEDRAQQWYTDRGYLVYDRNWRCAEGELDLVLGLVDGPSHTIVFSEVKTRSSLRFGSPFEAVGHDKQRRIRRLAMTWLAVHRARAHHLRFDVVAVTGGRIEVLEAAF